MRFSTLFFKKKKAFLLKSKQQNKLKKKKKDRLKFSLFRWGHSDYYFLVTDNQTSVSNNCEIAVKFSLKDTPEL